MSGTPYSPNLPISSSWKSTLSNAFQLLRRVKFLVEDTFDWGSFNPQVNYTGMTTSNVIVYRARYLKIWKFFWFSIDAAATLAAPLSPYIVIKIPYTIPLSSFTSDSIQGDACMVMDNSIFEPGLWYGLSKSNEITFIRSGVVNWSAGNNRIITNAFLEVN